MKRYLVLILLGIVVLTSGLLVGCDQGASPKPFPAPESEGEEVTSATPDSRELLAPKIYEKDIEGIPFFGWLDPEFARKERERGNFRFQIEAGNRVEGEVSVWRYDGDGTTTPETSDKTPVFCQVSDPFGNIILESKSNEAGSSRQEYPWQFAFFAATGGEYSLQVLTNSTSSVYGAHLKVTVYRE